MDIAHFQTPCRLYSIPAKILNNKVIFDRFKMWVKSQGLVINSETPFCFQRQNGRHCRSFKDGKCTRDFLRVARNFLMSEMDYYHTGTRPDAFYEKRRAVPLTLGQFISKQKQI